MKIDVTKSLRAEGKESGRPVFSLRCRTLLGDAQAVLSNSP